MISLNEVSYIEENGIKKAVILSYEKFLEIEDKLEQLEDIKLYENSLISTDEVFPLQLVEELIEPKQSKIKIFRTYRKMTIVELAHKLNLSEAYISQLENGKRNGTVEIMKKIADTLDVDIDMLV